MKKKLSALKLAHELIKIETKQIRKIPNVSSYKESVIKALIDLFDYYRIEDKKEIFKLYELEEQNIKIEKQFFEPYIEEEENLSYYETINYAADIFYKLVGFVSNKIYYICFYSEEGNDKFPSYSLEDNFWKIAFNFAKELDLPKNNLLNLYNELNNEERKYNNKINELENLSALAWFEKRRSLLEKHEWNKSNNKNNVISYLESISKNECSNKNKSENIPIENMDIFKKYRKERETEENKKAVYNQRRNQGITAIVRDYGILNNDESFNSLNYVGIQKLLNSDAYHIGFGEKEAYFKEDISVNINNKNLLLLLKFFKEIGIKGLIKQSDQKYKKVGDPQVYINKDNEKSYENMEWGTTFFHNMTLELSLKAKWNSQYNDIIEKLLISFNYDLSLLKYKDN